MHRLALWFLIMGLLELKGNAKMRDSQKYQIAI